MHSEREINQTCAGFTDHCVNGATCDPDTNLCTTVKTEYSKCYLYAIPGVLSTPFLCFDPTLSLSRLHRSLSVCLHVLICSGILSGCCNPLPPLTTSFITSSGVPRMQKSRSPVLRTQRYRRCILLSLTRPQWRLACFSWCQELCLIILFIYFFIAVLSIYSPLLSNSHSQLRIK